MNWDDLSSNNAKVRYACTKRAIDLSNENPLALYPELDQVVELLDSRRRVFNWTARQIVGNLSSVDSENRLEPVLPKIIELFHRDDLITSSNAIEALGKIARSNPGIADAIVTELLTIESATYRRRGHVSPECRNVAIGHVVHAVAPFSNKVEVFKFLVRQQQNPRLTVSRHARAILKGFCT